MKELDSNLGALCHTRAKLAAWERGRVGYAWSSEKSQLVCDIGDLERRLEMLRLLTRLSDERAEAHRTDIINTRLELERLAEAEQMKEDQFQDFLNEEMKLMDDEAEAERERERDHEDKVAELQSRLQAFNDDKEEWEMEKRSLAPDKNRRKELEGELALERENARRQRAELKAELAKQRDLLNRKRKELEDRAKRLPRERQKVLDEALDEIKRTFEDKMKGLRGEISDEEAKHHALEEELERARQDRGLVQKEMRKQSAPAIAEALHKLSSGRILRHYYLRLRGHAYKQKRAKKLLVLQGKVQGVQKDLKGPPNGSFRG